MIEFFTRGCGGECFHCGGDSPRLFIDGNIKFWACSETCIKENRLQIMGGVAAK
jgi:hypothetical protein